MHEAGLFGRLGNAVLHSVKSSGGFIPVQIAFLLNVLFTLAFQLVGIFGAHTTVDRPAVLQAVDECLEKFLLVLLYGFYSVSARALLREPTR